MHTCAEFMESGSPAFWARIVPINARYKASSEPHTSSKTATS
jgi:hypothetical protein